MTNQDRAAMLGYRLYEREDTAIFSRLMRRRFILHTVPANRVDAILSKRIVKTQGELACSLCGTKHVYDEIEVPKKYANDPVTIWSCTMAQAGWSYWNPVNILGMSPVCPDCLNRPYAEVVKMMSKCAADYGETPTE